MRRGDFYELPGPSAFLDGIEADIQEEGGSVILNMGRLAPPGWREELNRRMGSDWRWTPVDANESSPLAGLTKGVQSRNNVIDSVESIYNLEGIEQRIFIIEPSDEAVANTWMEFLPKFADITRQQPRLSRCSIVLSISSGPLKLMADNVMVKPYSFKGIVTPIDMLIYAYQHIPETPGNGVLRNLRAQLSMELSLWDFDLCKELAPLSAAALIEPDSILKRYAEKVGFQEMVSEEDNDRLIEAGARGLFEGEERFHSAMLVLGNDPKGIKQRVWRAQLRVLYPFVEEHRQKIITKYARLIKLPHTRKDGIKISSLQEMEIGDIKVNLYSNLQFHKKLKNFVRNLWIIRKDLAHLNVVSAKQLAERDLEWDYDGYTG